jgi:nitrite reductase/ring-hydroxylating ferredoxin subunit/uncharacterized membrane protein
MADPAQFDSYFEAGEPDSPAAHKIAVRVGGLEQLDGVGERLAAAVRSALPRGPVKDALSGTWLGHPLHPLMTDVPIGVWTSAMLLDLLGGREARSGADRLMAIGVVAALPTAASGLSDWVDSSRDAGVRRVGVAHAASNTLALALYGGSLAARRGGRRRLGVLLGLAGGGALNVGGWLGGHLSYGEGVGVDRTAFDPKPAEWTKAMAVEDLAEGTLRKVAVAGVDVLLSRREGRISAIANTCTHRGGPLDQGEVDDGCVTCPLHGSVFRLDDGSIIRGPASAPQPAFDVRVSDGQIEVRAA